MRTLILLRQAIVSPQKLRNMTKLQVDDPQHSVEKVARGRVSTLFFQIKLLVWKRYLESTKSKWDLIKVILPAVLFFALMRLLYSVFDFLYAGGLEEFIVPLAFWIYIQRIVVQIMFEKSSRLQESMRMMGLSDFAYWTSYFISEGVVVGFLLSLILAIISAGGLFNDGNFGVVLGYLFVFCLSVVPFSFFICSFFDTPQTSGQATLGLLFGVYITHIIVFLVELASIPVQSAQIICCFVPPIALQLGARSFLKSYDGLPLSAICGIMVADIFIYSILAWYFSQVWPSKVGVPKPWYFLLQRSYWFKSLPKSQYQEIQPLPGTLEDGTAQAPSIPTEVANEALLGTPQVVAHELRKSYGSHVVINDLSFSMYENQIFALLGHNGAGKTTVISMLTGLINPDATRGNNGASVYGHDILNDMDGVRQSMGVCPQHDVLFENLSVREHILFFAQLKSATYASAQAEANHLVNLFHLENRQHNLGSELSGGQRRKLSVVIAVCGGSKFVVLDEPSAGMDPLARRELWDLLASLRKGRTMLLTTHYMDEADILGDRVGIMSLGKMQCIGSTKFLKNTYGAGYKLVFDKVPDMTKDQLANLTAFMQTSIPEAKYFETDGGDEQAQYILPFGTVSKFGPLFTQLDESLAGLHVTGYNVTITSLEDVFLKVGEDHTVTPQEVKVHGIGARKYASNFVSQTIGIAWRKITYSFNDFITIPLLLLPVAVAIAAAIIYNLHVISDDALINDLVISALYLAGYLGAPGLIAEFIVRERNDKLRNVLTVMGCDFRAYWIGTFIADYIIMAIPMVVMWITWFAAGMSDFYAGTQGLNFFIMLLFNFHLVAFSYFFSFIFTDSKSCISLMPIVILMLIISPNIILLIVIQICVAAGVSISATVQGGILLWGIMILSPHGALLTAFLNTTQNFSSLLSSFPSIGAVIAFMIVESALFLGYAYYTDAQSVAVLPVCEDPHFNPAVLRNLDEDVKAERERTLSTIGGNEPLRVERLRKVFPPKRAGQKSVIANQDVTFKVESGEIFGLLGANGADKTVTLSMLTRHLTPTAGDAFIAKHSILSDFSKGATHLGVVTQNNSLWDRLSVEDHLFLFARLRGVPEDVVKDVVDGTIDQLELTPHRKKLAMRLSGGMKRKLCVAIALIGDPEVVLLDEPSAGLDPVSRRNLWSVILRTMSHRAVILTTHSMDEAEALCKRIGIMVQGQLRALGTKQHLKNKFGSGFELVVKLNVTDFVKQVAVLDTFVRGMFPSALQISENGGLITYTIPREEMKMGLAFSQLEAHKVELGIEEYSVAQPTLEQVFIRTVNKHTPGGAKNAGSTTVIGGSANMSVEGTQGFKEGETPEEDPDQEHIFGEVHVVLNRCGCTSHTACCIVLALCLLLACFLGVSIGVSVARSPAAVVLWIITIVILICTLISCCMRFCTICQAPKGADE